MADAEARHRCRSDRGPVPGGQQVSSVRDGRRGVVGNERLIALAGVAVLVLALVELVTVPTLRALLPVHIFVGALLAGPVLAKIGATGWRFLRYYTGSPHYRQKGPPAPLLRLLAPVLVISTITLIGSGIAMAITGPGVDLLVKVHIVSFVAWIGTLAIHVIAYARRVPALVTADWRREPESEPVPGRGLRLALNVAALIAGTFGAVLLLPASTPWVAVLDGGLSKAGVLGVLVALGTTVAAVIFSRRHPT